MKVSEMFKGKYLKAADYTDPKVETIAAVRQEAVGKEGDRKWVVYFEGESRGWVLNITNATTIAQLLGTEQTKEWRGRKVELYSTPVPFGNEVVDAIRVREPAGFADLEDAPF